MSETFRFRCVCAATFRVPVAAAGRELVCPKCRTSITVPSPVAPPAEECPPLVEYVPDPPAEFDNPEPDPVAFAAPREYGPVAVALAAVVCTGAIVAAVLGTALDRRGQPPPADWGHMGQLLAFGFNDPERLLPGALTTLVVAFTLAATRRTCSSAELDDRLLLAGRAAAAAVGFAAALPMTAVPLLGDVWLPTYDLLFVGTVAVLALVAPYLTPTAVGLVAPGAGAAALAVIKVVQINLLNFAGGSAGLRPGTGVWVLLLAGVACAGCYLAATPRRDRAAGPPPP